MDKLLFTTPFSTFDKWYVEYYLNARQITSKYPLIQLKSLIKPVKRSVKRSDYDGKLPIVSKIVFKTGKITFRKENKTGMDLLHVQKGDLLVSSINFHQGAIALNSTSDFMCSTHYQTFVIDRCKVIPEYLLHVLRTERFLKIVSGQKANGIKNESGYEFIGSFQIPLPSISEQKKLLNSHSKILSEASKNRRLGDERNADLLYDIQSEVSTLGRETSDAMNTGSILQTTKFSSISRWEVDFILKEGTCAQICKSFKYPCYSISQLKKESLFGLSLKASNKQKDGTIPMIRMSNIIDGTLDTKEMKYLPYNCAITNREPRKWLLQKGDLLINRTNSKELVGKTAVFDLDGDYTYASYVIRYRFDTNMVIPEYINILFVLPIVREQIDAMSRQTAGQCNINSDEIGSIRIPVPSTLKKQQELVDLYNRTKNVANEYYRKANELQQKADSDFQAEIFNM